jgi:putative ABC transport system ATP-binding protein
VSAGLAIVLDGVSKSFEHGRVVALRDVSFQVAEREFVALTGASGSGKSTLLNLIGALDTPDSGTIVVEGQRLDQLTSASGYRASTIGFVFQSHYLLPTLTASENVQVPMFGRLPRHERVARAAELLDEVGLADRAQAQPGVLSGGERQRVAIARALANQPRVLLADEPTGALDSANGEQVIRLLKELRDLHGMTVLLVTNDDAMARHADRRLRLRDGVIRAEAPLPAPA